MENLFEAQVFSNTAVKVFDYCLLKNKITRS
jgi:hypothetical protein